jgi:membrane protein DedA with SNARE-associated domain
MEHLLESWGYVAVFVLSLISAVGLPAGSEVAVIYGGVLASGQIANEPHRLNLFVVIFLATLAELLGSAVAYLIGLSGGRPLMDRLGHYVLLTHNDLDRAERWFGRHGPPAVLFGRFIPLLRSLVSFAAGVAEMAFAKFALFTLIGCGLWCSALATLGYSLGSSYRHVLKTFSFAGYFAAALFVVAVIIVVAHRVRTVRRENAEPPAVPLSEPPGSAMLSVSDRPADTRVIDMTQEEVHAWVAATVDKIGRQGHLIEQAGHYLKAVIAAHTPESQES